MCFLFLELYTFISYHSFIVLSGYLRLRLYAPSSYLNMEAGVAAEDLRTPDEEGRTPMYRACVVG